MSENIYLIGFMGTGKSTAADYLHKKLSMEMAEMDQLIEARAGMPISRIFEKYGEEYFRNLETELLIELSEKERLVVSCGGGTPMRDRNVREMRKSGTIVLLTASPETIFSRVKDSHSRPLLEQNKSVDYIAKLLEQRRSAYEAAADLVIETDQKSMEEICGELLQGLEGAYEWKRESAEPPVC